MITAIFETRNDEVDLAHALTALVPAALEGAIREVVVVDYGSTDGTLEVADAAGCTVCPAGDSAVHDAAEAARGDWLLFIKPTARVAADWHDGALEFIDRALVSGKALAATATLRNGQIASGWLAWLRGFLRAPEGRLMSKGAYLAATSSQPSAASSVADARRGAA
jgi:Glycosyl transferase family 2